MAPELSVGLLSYIVCGLILNMIIEFSFRSSESAEPWEKKLDKVLTVILFQVLWPLGLVLFALKWYQGKADIS